MNRRKTICKNRHCPNSTQRPWVTYQWKNFILYFLILIIIFSLNSCSTSEEGLIKELNNNPDDTDIIAELADFYYSNKQYRKAYKQYKKLVKLNSITEDQQYIKAICGTMIPFVSKKSWEELSKLRKTISGTHKSFRHNGFVFSIPEHWIPFSGKSRPSLEFINQFDFSYSYEDASIPEYTGRKIRRSLFSGYIYAGNEFIINYRPLIPKRAVSSGGGVTVYYFKGLDKTILSFKTSLMDQQKDEIIKNLEFYRYNKRSSKMEKILYMYLKGDIFHSSKRNIVYATYIIPLKNINSDKWEPVRFISAVMVGPRGRYKFDMKTQFNDKYSDIYMKEIDRFLIKSRGIDISRGPK